jgi:hypothetical protein
MSQNLESVFDAARELPPGEQRELAERLLTALDRTRDRDEELAANLAIVERTYGTIKGVDRETIIRIANDEEFCGY